MKRKNKVVTFGEVMMRLSPPGFAKFPQATELEMAYGGGEANVAISLAYMGLKAIHVTRFPDNMLGKAATQFLRQNWIDTSGVFYGGNRLGKYFLEKGAVHRPSEVVYERDNSSFATAEPSTYNWREILDGADWFHWTGITPAISQNCADACLEALTVANELGVTVSSDVFSRKNLWKYGKDKTEIMPALIEKCDVVIASPYDVSEVLGIEMPDSAGIQWAKEKLTDTFPRIKMVFDKDREMVSASHNRIRGKMWDGHEIFRTEYLDVTHIIDRVGTGDAFAAGLIFGLIHYENDKEALEFATAACALKHTIEGDANIVSFENVENLMRGNTSGRIIR